MSDLIETIKTKLDLVEEIGLVVALHKSGKAFQGLCPFHNERSPSFYVFVETQTWRCFGCNEGGDIFSFVEKQQNLEFRDALLYLAEKAGVALDEQPGRDPQEARETHARKERLRKLNEDALLWFHQQLLRSHEAAEARAYLQGRGISSESVMAFSLGYAPERWDGLSNYLLKQGYSEDELVDGGLAKRRDGGGVYDTFRQRLIFPIRDIRGRVIGFGGRILGAGEPKYLNSQQTLLFEKSNILYALDMAKDAIKQEKQVIIVEGYVDALMAHQYGTKQTVACIGSAITEKHIHQLKKLTRQVTLALDSDAAGIAATEHGVQAALKGFDRTIVPVPLPAHPAAGNSHARGNRKQQEPPSIIRLEEQVDAEINVLQLPEGEDPDEFIMRDFAAWEYAVQHPLPLIDYYFAAHTARLNLREAAGQAQAAKRLLPVLAMITDRTKRDAYLRQLARLLRMDERSLNGELQHVLHNQPVKSIVVEFSERGGSTRQEGKYGQGSVSTGLVEKGGGVAQHRTSIGLDSVEQTKILREDYLLGLLLQNPKLSEHVYGIINDGDFAGTDTRELYRIFNAVYQRGSSPFSQSLETAVPAALQGTVERVRKCVEDFTLSDEAHLVRDAKQCAIRLKRAHLLRSETELRYLMKEAEEAGDVATDRLLRHQFMVVRQELLTINTAMRLHG